MLITKLITVVLLFVSVNLFASEARPGLWEISMKITQDGKEFDPMAEFKKQMEAMPEEHKKMILDQLKKTSGFAGLNQMCYTKEMLQDPSQVATGDMEECSFVETNRSKNKIIGKFKCKDGSSGSSTWEIKDSKNMQVLMDFKDKDGKSGKMNYTAKFVKDKCD